MATNDYQFITDWRVEGQVQEVYDIISDPTILAQWWPAVYLEVQEIAPGGERGIGKIVRLHTKGWLPYTLHWDAETTEAEPPHRLALAATGDFVGGGVWTFEPDGPWVNISFDWRIRADKPLLRALSFLLKPIFAANHRWAMEKGEQSLRLEIARRHASPDQQPLLPAPPGPSTTSTYRLLLGMAVVALAIYAERRKDE